MEIMAKMKINRKFMKNKNSKNAFTIIEFLIALCIICIAIAGIFFVKKIIKENNVKSLIMQIKKYDAALNNFTQKYQALPGDLKSTVTYGITEYSTDGNNDNIITDRVQQILMANGEITKFWLHLSKTKMIDENYDGKDDNDAKNGSTFPLSKIGENSGIAVFGNEGKTFYQIGFKFADTDRLYTNNRSLKSEEAFLFDRKIDDGNPQKGRIIAVGGDMLNVPTNEECVKLGEYNQSTISPVCQLRIEAR